MPRQKAIRNQTTILSEHPAVKAWTRLSSDHGEPRQIDVLNKKKKSQVYLLRGLRPGDFAIVAKRSVLVKAAVERTIYEEILPRLPVFCTQYHGFVEEEGGQYGWLFLGHVDGVEYSADIDNHRSLSALWLADLHSSAAQVAVHNQLPGRGPNHYLTQLLSAHDRVVRGLDNPLLNTDDKKTLKNVVSQCSILRSRWSDVEQLCKGMPQTLVHGDFAPKNMRICALTSGLTLQVFDWGTAGWGDTAADLVQSASPVDNYWVSPNLEIYCSMMRDHWPQLDVRTMQEYANVGKIFRSIVGLNGDAKSLETQWIQKAMGNIRLYQSHIEESFQSAGFPVSIRPV